MKIKGDGWEWTLSEFYRDYGFFKTAEILIKFSVKWVFSKFQSVGGERER